ncbi:hypothetical protein GINT2_001440 [Glugoides intestinalis]
MDMKKLKEQIEFYFSDSNYARDSFLIAKAAENDGFVQISVLLTFKRLRAMNPTVEDVKEAVKDSNVVELNEDSLRKIKTQEFADYLNDKDISKRVVHMKGFCITSTLDDVKELLEAHCKPSKITLRRTQLGEFTGSCFVEFKTKEEAEEVLKLRIELCAEKIDEDAKKQKIEPAFLEIVSKTDYLESKKTEKEKEKEKKFSEKVKTSFIQKLYKYQCPSDIDIKAIKEAVPNCAFVDTSKNVIRLKFVEEWTEKEFTLQKDDKEKVTIKLSKMSDEEAKEHVKGISIKKIKR